MPYSIGSPCPIQITHCKWKIRRVGSASGAGFDPSPDYTYHLRAPPLALPDPLMDWRQHYRENLVSPDEAVSTIASGDGVTVSVNPHPNLLLDALAARRR